MSSFITHAVVGAALGRHQKVGILETFVIIGFCWAPDADYFFRWIGYEAEPRWTHSIAAAGILWAAFILMLPFIPFLNQKKRLAGLSLIAISFHLFFDWLVGGPYGDPLLWPLTDQNFSSPIGILPAAGKFDLSNYYFWRNMVIEAGIIGPIIACFYLKSHNKLFSKGGFIAIGCFVIFVFGGMSLAR